MPAPEPIKFYCPFGCLNAGPNNETQFDDKGYCKHLVGFVTLPEGAGAVGRLYEPLEPTGHEQEGKLIGAGFLRVNGRKKQPVLEGDVVVSPRELQQRRTIRNDDDKIVFRPKLGISSWVFRKDANTPVVLRPDEGEAVAEILQRVEDKKAEIADLLAQAEQADKTRREGEKPAVEFGDVQDGARNKKAEDDERKAMKARRQPQPA